MVGNPFYHWNRRPMFVASPRHLSIRWALLEHCCWCSWAVDLWSIEVVDVARCCWWWWWTHPTWMATIVEACCWQWRAVHQSEQCSTTPKRVASTLLSTCFLPVVVVMVGVVVHCSHCNHRQFMGTTTTTTIRWCPISNNLGHKLVQQFHSSLAPSRPSSSAQREPIVLRCNAGSRFEYLLEKKKQQQQHIPPIKHTRSMMVTQWWWTTVNLAETPSHPGSEPETIEEEEEEVANKNMSKSNLNICLLE